MRKGSHKTDEQRANQSAGMMGHPSRNSSPEACANMSAAQHTARLNHSWAPVTDETRARMSAAKKGKRPSDACRMASLAVHKGKRPSDACMAAGHTPEAQAKRTLNSKGHVWSLEERTKMSGENNPLWKGGRKAAHVRDKAQRRALPSDPIFLNLSFDVCDGHHLDPDHVLYIPRTLHQSVQHDHSSGRGMEQINALALAYAGLTANVLDDNTLPFD